MSKASVKRKFESFGFSSNPLDQAKQTNFLIYLENQLQIGNDFQLKLHSWMKISMLKQQVQQKTGLQDFRLVYRNQELTLNSNDLEDYGIRQGAVLKITQKRQHQYKIIPFEILDQNSKSFAKFNQVKWDVEAAFSSGITPKLTDFGTQGTYLLEGLERRQSAAIFKPLDEEAFAPNNPRGYVGKMKSTTLRPGILSGEGVDREVAAYLIDEAYGGYHSVPITTFVQICHPTFKGEWEQEYKQFEYEKVPIKSGSFQIYVKHDDNVGNYGSSLFPDREARKIAMLDIRILNCDRNEENILVRKKKIQQSQTGKKQTYDFELIPIDHGYSFPDRFQICRDEVVWFHWDQMTHPYTAEERKFINELKPDRDEALIRSKLKFREICLRNFRISSMLLKQGASSGLTLNQIAMILFREDSGIESPLELVVKQAEENYKLGNRIPNRISDFKCKAIIKNNLTQKSLEFKNMQQFKEEPQLQVQRTLQRVSSQNDIKENGRKISYEQQWDAEFYQHIEWFLQQLIESKIHELRSPTKRNHRDRYKSENID